MSPHVPDPPPEDEGLRFHAGLLNGDAAAPDEFAEHYLDWLIARLHTSNPSIDPQLCEQAAGDAIFSLIKNPERFDPGRSPLAGYLRMSAQGDLKNLLRTETRRNRGREPWNLVEESPDAGNILGREDDPSFRLRLAEEQANPILEEVRRGLSPEHLRCLELLLEGVRENSAYAEALGCTHLPDEEQQQAGNRVKNMLKARLKRAGWNDGTSD